MKAAVNSEHDVAYVDLLVTNVKQSGTPLPHFAEMFPEYDEGMALRQLEVHALEGSSDDGTSDLTGLLLLVCFAMMNVQDVEGMPQTELIPFVSIIGKEKQNMFPDGVRKLSILLLGMSRSPVRARSGSEAVVDLTLGGFGNLTLAFVNVYSAFIRPMQSVHV